MSDDGWKALHPASVAVNLVPRAWIALRGLWPLLLAALLGRSSTPNHVVDGVLVLMLLSSTVGATVLHWLSLRYRVLDGRLEIRTGLLARQTRTIDVTRVQNVEVVRNLFQRLAGLAEVRVETASGREVEGLLSAVSVEEAEALVAALGGRRTGEAVETLVENDLGDLLRYGATGTRFAQAAIGLSLAIEAVQWYVADVRLLSPEAYLALVPLAAIGAWLAGTFGAVLAYQGYALSRTDDGRLAVDGGLFTRRRVEWRPAKVQAVLLDEPWLRRLVGIASVRVETAAATRGEGGTRTAEALVPVVSAERLGAVVSTVSALAVDPATVAWREPHPFVRVRMLLRAIVQSIALTGLGVAALGAPGAAAGLVAPFLLAKAWIDAANVGWALTDDALLVRTGFFRRETSVVPRAKVQSVTLLQPAWWRRRRVARLAVNAAGVQIAVPPLDEDEARALLAALVPGQAA